MVTQLQVVSILMIVHGSLGVLFGLLYAVLGPTMMALTRFQPGPQANPQDETVMAVVSVVYLVIGLAFLIVGVLNIIGGARMLKFRGRTFGMAVLICNVVYLPACYCIPFSLGLLVYGIVVLVDRDVTRSFQMATEGISPQEIRHHFRSHRRYDPEEDDGPDSRDYPEDEGPRERWRDRRAGGDKGIQRDDPS